ncbi:hypothetical protein LOS78_12775 [Paracoccus sp. MA]|uniref:hypothetical protein n=1 Tax=Paracoccus sp. MA TaxID=2895796 RepID=UPI001E33B5FA|nr:hypothetical protein [Paracoccus sp. MA]UFM66800.1 hypothetical protein LOS78_12775 [Paracoccus sp. MA]
MSDIVSLLDIAPLEFHAELSVGKVRVYRLGAGDIAQMFLIFPGIRAIFSDRPAGPGEMVRLAQELPDAIPYLVSYACGLRGPDGIAAARNLPAADQMIVIEKVKEISLPEGGRDFFAAAERLLPQQAEPGAGTKSRKSPAKPAAPVPDVADMADLMRP